MDQTTYDPCDPKAAWQQQRDLQFSIGCAILAAATIWASIFGALWLACAQKAFPNALEFISIATLIAVTDGIIFWVLSAGLYLAFKPTIDLAICQLKAKTTGQSRTPGR